LAPDWPVSQYRLELYSHFAGYLQTAAPPTRIIKVQRTLGTGESKSFWYRWDVCNKRADTAGNSNQVNFRVYAPQQGPQPFSALSGYSMGGQESQIAVGDFDGDGLADVVTNAIASGFSPNLAIFRGQRDGTLATAKFINGAGTAFAVGDVNGDGTNDIITALYPASASSGSTSSFTILLNDGKSNFAPGSPVSSLGLILGQLCWRISWARDETIS